MRLEFIKVRPEDLSRLQKISRETFVEAFSEDNSEEDMREYLEVAFGEKMQLQEITHPFSLAEGKITGYMKLNEQSAQTEQGFWNTVELQRIYVYEEFKRNGVGKGLMEKAISFAMERRASYLWLGVWENNYPAILFYESFGFEKFSEHIFMLGREAQKDLLLRKML